MTARIPLAMAGAFCIMAASPALASPCGNRILALERRLDAGTASAAAASSGGQAVAAAREGQAANPGTGGEAATPFQDSSRERQATRQAAEAGGGGGGMAEARATLNRARTLDQEGNEAGCMAALDEAERQSAPRP